MSEEALRGLFRTQTKKKVIELYHHEGGDVCATWRNTKMR